MFESGWGFEPRAGGPGHTSGWTRRAPPDPAVDAVEVVEVDRFLARNLPSWRRALFQLDRAPGERTVLVHPAGNEGHGRPNAEAACRTIWIPPAAARRTESGHDHRSARNTTPLKSQAPLYLPSGDAYIRDPGADTANEFTEDDCSPN